MLTLTHKRANYSLILHLLQIKTRFTLFCIIPKNLPPFKFFYILFVFSYFSRKYKKRVYVHTLFLSTKKLPQYHAAAFY